MVDIVEAGPTEILRSVQKDEEYLSYLRENVSAFVRSVKGIPFWIKYQDDISAAADLLYYTLTTLSTYQTLGEEYVNIIQVSGNQLNVPGRFSRSLFVFLKSLAPVIVSRNRHLRGNRYAFSLLLKLHLIIFYLFGGYHDPAKRVTGIRYVLLRKWMRQSQLDYVTKLLGILSLTQLALSIIITNRSQDYTTDEDETVVKTLETSSSTVDRCSLCMDDFTAQTTCLCGHVFCWKCIASWLQTNPQCPKCRDPCLPQQIVRIQNR